MQDKLFIGASFIDGEYQQPQYLCLPYASRHGLITGATGTGKTISLQILAQSFSQAGVPVFCADLKGDLSGIAKEGSKNEKLEKRAKQINLSPYEMSSAEVLFWDVFGEDGHPFRASIADVGPLLLAQLLELTNVQAGILEISFRIARDKAYNLITLDDLQQLLSFMSSNISELGSEYGNITKASIGSIQRSLLRLEEQGAKNFFSFPTFEINDLLHKTDDGQGVVSLLAASKLVNNPKLYATVFLWLLTDLYNKLPEVGEVDKPKLVLFFDEAHFLFTNSDKHLTEKIEQIIRLIRFKGVGLYFISQSPMDLPKVVLSQLGNRIQHALRAYTPKELQALKEIAKTFPENPNFDSFSTLSSLGTGEALVSMLGEKAIPQMVQKTLIRPPSSHIGSISNELRREIIANDIIGDKYKEQKIIQDLLVSPKGEEKASKQVGGAKKLHSRQTVWEATLKSAFRSIATNLGKRLANNSGSLIQTIIKILFGKK